MKDTLNKIGNFTHNKIMGFGLKKFVKLKSKSHYLIMNVIANFI